MHTKNTGITGFRCHRHSSHAESCRIGGLARLRSAEATAKHTPLQCDNAPGLYWSRPRPSARMITSMPGSLLHVVVMDGLQRFGVPGERRTSEAPAAIVAPSPWRAIWRP